MSKLASLIRIAIVGIIGCLAMLFYPKGARLNTNTKALQGDATAGKAQIIICGVTLMLIGSELILSSKVVVG